MLEVLAAATLWLSPGGLSHHAQGGYNERNPGLGAEVQLDRHRFAAGQYKNSISQRSSYVTYGYVPWQIERGALRLSLGGAAGVVDGYRANHGRFVPVLGPVLSVDWGPVGVNVVAWPRFGDNPAGGAVQFRLHVW